MIDPSILRVLIPVLFTVLVLPLATRFVIGKILFRRVRREYLAPLEERFLKTADDKAVYEGFTVFLKAKIGAPYARNLTVKEDITALLLLVQNAFARGGTAELKFAFSVSDLVKCSFLLMDELDSMLRTDSRFRTLALSRVATLRRINRLSGYYNRIFEKLPFLRFLKEGRLAGTALRALLIPLLGLPTIAVSLAASVTSLFFTETLWRYYYAILLAKAFHYALILYGDRKGPLREKLEAFSRERVLREASRVESLILPGSGDDRSPLYEGAFLLYQRALEAAGIGPEKDVDFGGVVYRFNGKRRFFKRLFRIPLRAANRYNPLTEGKTDDRALLLGLIREVASPYNPSERFYDNLRLVDLFDSLYMLSLLGYSRILSGAFVLDAVSVDFLLTAKNVGEELLGEVMRQRIPYIGRYYRTVRLYRKVRFIYKAARSANAVNLIYSLTGPLAAEGIMAGVRDYLYRRVGRMTLYCFESNYLKKKRLF